MFDISFSELLLCFIIALVVLGPERLPGIARGIGRWTGKARSYMRNLSAELDRETSVADFRRQVADAKRVFQEESTSMRRDFEAESAALKRSFEGQPAAPADAAAAPAAAPAPAVEPAAPEPAPKAESAAPQKPLHHDPYV